MIINLIQWWRCDKIAFLYSVYSARLFHEDCSLRNFHFIFRFIVGMGNLFPLKGHFDNHHTISWVDGVVFCEGAESSPHMVYFMYYVHYVLRALDLT